MYKENTRRERIWIATVKSNVSLVTTELAEEISCL